jgi:hypothetical protein
VEQHWKGFRIVFSKLHIKSEFYCFRRTLKFNLKIFLATKRSAMAKELCFMHPAYEASQRHDKYNLSNNHQQNQIVHSTANLSVQVQQSGLTDWYLTCSKQGIAVREVIEFSVAILRNLIALNLRSYFLHYGNSSSIPIPFVEPTTELQ